MKSNLILLLIFLHFTSICCKKEHLNDTPPDENPFKVTVLTPLPDPIPYKELGSGKILFERFYDHSESEFYIIDIDKRKSYGFTLKSHITEPNISPSGTKIACSLLNSADAGSFWNIYIMNTDGSDCFPAFKTDKDSYYPTWNSDGSKIVFYTSGPDGILYSQSAAENSSDRTEMIKFHYEEEPLWVLRPSGGFSISPEGNLIGVSKSETLFGIIGIRPYTRRTGTGVLVTPSTDLEFVSPNFQVESPVFSPDRTKVAFASIYTNPAESGWISLGIQIMDPDGSDVILVGGTGGAQSKISRPRYTSLAWSPDGTKILFSLPDGEMTSHLFIVNIDGTGYYQVTNQLNAFDSEVSWSR
jgi:dipeptidyl aminopeptidase/acylaminoacyl peptidase